MLKVGPDISSTDSQSETFDSDTATGEKRLKSQRKLHLTDGGEPDEKKVYLTCLFFHYY